MCYYIYIIGMLFKQIITNIITAIVSNKFYPNYHAKGNISKRERSKINHHIRDLFAMKLGNIITDSVDTIVISAYIGLTELAIYQNYYIILKSVVAGIGNSLITESLDKNYHDFKKMNFLIAWVICICSSCFIGLYQPFMKLWVGEKLMLDEKFIPIFCAYYFVLGFQKLWEMFKDAAGLWHEDRFRPLIGALFNLLLNLILVNYIGLYGILISTILSCMLITMPWLIHNIFKLLYRRSPLEFLKQLGIYSLLTVISTFGTYLVCHFILIEGIVGLILKLIISVFIPNLLLLICLHRWEEFKIFYYLIQKIMRKFLKIKQKN